MFNVFYLNLHCASVPGHVACSGLDTTAAAPLVLVLSRSHLQFAYYDTKHYAGTRGIEGLCVFVSFFILLLKDYDERSLFYQFLLNDQTFKIKAGDQMYILRIFLNRPFYTL